MNDLDLTMCVCPFCLLTYICSDRLLWLLTFTEREVWKLVGWVDDSWEAALMLVWIFQELGRD